ncbi:MAG: AAA family ATPase [Chloroflexi bacterium]|nr:AAA family ATPase [Chloroflexota bacterium]
MAAVSVPGSMPDRTKEARRALIASLTSPDGYAHEVERPIRHIETHISDLFLTGRYVYKVKKPVDLGFVDYSTLELRRRFTELELELNRRISPDVYLGIEPITLRPGGGFRVGGDGEVVEYALKMRQLPLERSFGALLRTGVIGPEETREVARLVARFHGDADVVGPTSPLGGVDTLHSVTGDNLSVIARFTGVSCSSDDLDDISAYTSAFLHVNRDLIDSRKERGFVRDCHGDLHAGNLFLDDDGIHVIDRIEFNDRFRFIDVASDLAFLAMDLAHAGKPELADVLVDTYVSETRDEELRRLIDFYVLHRACVRCKVTSLLLDEAEEPAVSRRTEVIAEASSYGRLAAKVVARQRPQAVYLMAGLMGSGKSTLADELSRRWGMERFSSDVVRKTLAGLDPERVSDESVRNDLYARDMSDRTYSEMIRLGAEAIDRGGSVVLDAAFILKRHRSQTVAMARDRGVPVYIVEARVPESVALTRLQDRYASGESSSDGRPELLAWHRSESEPIDAVEADGHVVVDNVGGIDAAARAALAGLWRLVLAGR